MNDILVELTNDELMAIQDHLRATISLNEEIQNLRGRLIREQRDLEISFSNAMRRDMLERGTNGDVPEFIGTDGRLNMQIDQARAIRWVDGRKPEGE